MTKTIKTSKFRAVLISAIAAAIVLACITGVCAEAAVPKPTDLVADEAGVLSEATVRSIQKTNRDLTADTGASIAVCTVLTTGDEDIAAFSRRVFKDWKMGEGVLLVIASDDQNYYFVQSVGVDDILTNEVLTGIRDGYLEDDFAAGEIDRGVSKCVSKLAVELTKGLVNSGSDESEDGETESGGTAVGAVIVGFFKFILYAALFVLIAFVALFVWAMFNDDVAALMQKYIFRRGKSTGYRAPESYYDDRLYGQSRRPAQNQRSQSGQRRPAPRYDTYGNPIPPQRRQSGQPAQRKHSHNPQRQNESFSGDETRAFSIPESYNNRRR